jgi:hypothetical protein
MFLPALVTVIAGVFFGAALYVVPRRASGEVSEVAKSRPVTTMTILTNSVDGISWTPIRGQSRKQKPSSAK